MGTSASVIKDCQLKNVVQTFPGAKLSEHIPDKIFKLISILSNSLQLGAATVDLKFNVQPINAHLHE